MTDMMTFLPNGQGMIREGINLLEAGRLQRTYLFVQKELPGSVELNCLYIVG